MAGCVGSPTTRAQVSAQTSPSAAALPARTVTKVITIVEENHGLASARAGMPYLRSAADNYGLATDYESVTQPSLPNYLLLTGGSSFGIHDDDPPSRHPLSGPSVFDAVLQAHGSAKAYVESMHSNCQSSDLGRYAVKHNPWPYFGEARSRRNCSSLDVPAGSAQTGALHTDVVAGRLPQVGLLVPNLCNDAHDCPLSVADGWLKSWVAALMSGPDWRAGRLAIVVTFDEDEDTGKGRLLTAILWPGLRHKQVSARLTHLSWTRWMTDLVHAPPLRSSANAPSLGAAFGLE